MKFRRQQILKIVAISFFASILLIMLYVFWKLEVMNRNRLAVLQQDLGVVT